MLWAASYLPSGAMHRAYGASTQAMLDAMVADAGDPYPVAAASRCLRATEDFWDGSAWAERPVPPAPPALTAGVEAVWATGLPEGAEIVATSGLTGQIAGIETVDASGDARFVLPAGPWRLQVNESFPFRAVEFSVEVAEA